jgi:hypothetical protein
VFINETFIWCCGTIFKMRYVVFLLTTFVIASCGNVPDTKILCECYNERSKSKYETREGRYIQEPNCASEISGLINEKEDKFLIKKNNNYLHFRDKDTRDINILWQDSKISALGVDTYGDDITFTLDRINLKSNLWTTVIFDKTTALGKISMTIEQKYQCKVVEGI